jgi:hypothetical protein
MMASIMATYLLPFLVVLLGLLVRIEAQLTTPLSTSFIGFFVAPNSGIHTPPTCAVRRETYGWLTLRAVEVLTIAPGDVWKTSSTFAVGCPGGDDKPCTFTTGCKDNIASFDGTTSKW